MVFSCKALWMVVMEQFSIVTCIWNWAIWHSLHDGDRERAVFATECLNPTHGKACKVTLQTACS